MFTFTGPVTLHLHTPPCDLTPLESFMTALTDALTALNAQADANTVAIADLVSDVQLLITAVTTGDPAAVALAESLATKLSAEGAAVAAADADVEAATGVPTP